jgi:hypothetical protein
MVCTHHATALCISSMAQTQNLGSLHVEANRPASTNLSSIPASSGCMVFLLIQSPLNCLGSKRPGKKNVMSNIATIASLAKSKLSSDSYTRSPVPKESSCTYEKPTVHQTSKSTIHARSDSIGYYHEHCNHWREKNQDIGTERRASTQLAEFVYQAW